LLDRGDESGGYFLDMEVTPPGVLSARELADVRVKKLVVDWELTSCLNQLGYLSVFGG